VLAVTVEPDVVEELGVFVGQVVFHILNPLWIAPG
jgi:hypothetical protein